MTTTVQMFNESYAGSTLQLSGSRTYLVGGDGVVTVDQRNYLELMNLGFWPVSPPVEVDLGDYDPGDFVPLLDALLNQGI